MSFGCLASLDKKLQWKPEIVKLWAKEEINHTGKKKQLGCHI